MGCPRDGADGRLRRGSGIETERTRLVPANERSDRNACRETGFFRPATDSCAQRQEDGDKSRIRGMERKLAANCDHVAKGPGGSQG